jgi:hypothetical protein
LFSQGVNPGYEAHVQQMLHERALIINHLAQLFAGFEKRDALRGDMHALTCLGVSAIPRVTLAHAKAPEPTQLHLVSLCESVGDTTEQRIDDQLTLLFR